MLWYIREEGWCYRALHGPFETEKEAMRWKPSNSKNVSYHIFSSKELLQPA